MPENQNIEYKETWRDEYLKWICGFANAQGGKIYIGVDDNHNVKGVANSKRLLEDIPNKIANYLGIVCDVNLLQQEGKDIVEIVVRPSTIPISYHGEIHYRSGATKQELKGIALQQFILKKMNLSWDRSPVPDASIDDIDTHAIEYFVRHALSGKRLPAACEQENTEQILKRLHLIEKNGQLCIAALLLFGKDIEKWVPSSIFKIGRFGANDGDLIIQDVVSCPLILMPTRVMETLRSRYLVSPIHYEGLQRKEPLEIPETGLREILCNAIVHKDYQATSIQMKVWDDHITIWNPGTLPPDYTIETLLGEHESHPRNELIAKVFYLAGFIESWGRGYTIIHESFQEAQLQPPTFEQVRNGLKSTIKRETFVALMKGESKHDGGNGGGNEGKTQLTDLQLRILYTITNNANITARQLAVITKVPLRSVERALAELKKSNIIKRVGSPRAGRWIVTDDKNTY